MMNRKIRTISSVRPKSPIFPLGSKIAPRISLREQIKNISSTQVFNQFTKDITRMDGAQNLLQTQLGPEGYKRAIMERQKQMNGENKRSK